MVFKTFLNLRFLFYYFNVEEGNKIQDSKYGHYYICAIALDFHILNLSHITSGLTIQVKTVRFNLKTVSNFLNVFVLVLKLSYSFGQSRTTLL